MTAALIVSGLALTQSPALGADARFAQAPTTATEQKPAKAAVDVTKVRGTIAAIDKDAGTVTLKGPKGRTMMIEVKDRSKLDLVKVGDPVLVTYVEALAIRVEKAGSATPGASVQEARVTSKPGENPAGAVGREVTIVGTITAIDRKAQTVTIKGPRGNTETIKAQDPKNLEAIKVGDMVEIRYTQALAVQLDRAVKVEKK